MGLQSSASTPPRAILLLRTSALGDVVHCLPVASELRRHYPAARLGWVVEEPYLPLVASHPAVDEAIPVALRRWRRRPLAATTRRELLALRRRLRGFSADLALDLMGNHKAGALAWLSGAPRRVGASRRQRREPSSAWWINSPLPLSGIHAVDRALSLVRACCGVANDSGAPPDFGGSALLPAPPELQPEAGGYLLLQVGAGWANKRYPPAWWGAVAAALADDGLPVHVLAGPGEEPLGEAAVAASAGRAGLVSPADLPALGAWLRGARLVVGGDTGPLHLAHALGVPVLALHGPTDPARHGPYAAPERALARVLPCSYCYRRFAETKACLLELSPTQVARRVRALLEA